MADPYDLETLDKLIGAVTVLKPDLAWLLEDTAHLRRRLGWAALAGYDFDFKTEFAQLDALEAAVRELQASLPEAEKVLLKLREKADG
jgi:hypothetical protein